MSGTWLAEEGYAESAGWGPREHSALSKGLGGTSWFCMTKNCAGTRWGRTKPHLKTESGRPVPLERRRISRELHDGLGPSLADLGNRLRVCRQLVRDDPLKAQTGLDEVILLLRGHVGKIRELINELRPLTLDQLGLVQALRQYVERFGHETGIDCSIDLLSSA